MNETVVIEAVRKTVTVDCVVEEAFRVFTSDARTWWPVASHSINGEDVQEIVFEPREGGEVYELADDGARGHWATVLAWDPPSRLVLEWNIRNAAAVPTEVEIMFVPDGERTRIELEHRGWEKIHATSTRAGRDDYDEGWEHVLGCYAERVAG
jgi:uncharacterized protein YndB with AHSA1/START domain